MLDCLTGYIGLASVVGTAESGLYLDALPGINLFNVLKIADSSQKNPNGEYSVEKVFSDVQQRTILKFRTLFITEFNRCFKFYKRNGIDCLVCENRELLAVALWYLMGAEMSEECLRSDRINRYTTVDRQKIKEQKEGFLDAFYTEISAAIAGIDLEGSECFTHDAPECGGIIQVIETCP
ncbi:MAG: hypothetical protein LBP72_01110 [Dysgonamonadaceae bacterium]|jgi:hypothetical protein|nr:hypothetical protein [Dysgonamonadaceae bacterium]